MMLVISLTSIPPRLPQLFKTLNSLRQQCTSVEVIELCLPKRFKRFPDFEVRNVGVPDGVVLRTVENDLGPATKVLPTAMAWRGQDVRILYCDDDKKFDQDWAAGFLKSSAFYEAKGHDRFALATIGVCVDWYDGATSSIQPRRRPTRQKPMLDFSYRWNKLNYSFNTKILGKSSNVPSRSRWFSSSGQIDIMEGYGGVLVKPDFFQDSDLEIPDPIWRVDDIWLSGLLASRKIPIFANYHSKLPYAHDFVGHGLAEEVVSGLTRKDLDQMAIKYFQIKYGVWN